MWGTKVVLSHGTAYLEVPLEVANIYVPVHVRLALLLCVSHVHFYADMSCFAKRTRKRSDPNAGVNLSEAVKVPV